MAHVLQENYPFAQVPVYKDDKVRTLLDCQPRSCLCLPACLHPCSLCCVVLLLGNVQVRSSRFGTVLSRPLQLPPICAYLQVTMGQSNAIMRYLGRLHGMAGADAVEGAVIDQVGILAAAAAALNWCCSVPWPPARHGRRRCSAGRCGWPGTKCVVAVQQHWCCCCCGMAWLARVLSRELWSTRRLGHLLCRCPHDSPAGIDGCQWRCHHSTCTHLSRPLSRPAPTLSCSDCGWTRGYQAEVPCPDLPGTSNCGCSRSSGLRGPSLHCWAQHALQKHIPCTTDDTVFSHACSAPNDV